MAEACANYLHPAPETIYGIVLCMEMEREAMQCGVRKAEHKRQLAVHAIPLS